MKKVIIVLIVIVMLGAVGFFWFYHLVQTKDGFQVVAKKKASFTDSYLDTRDWNALDYLKYPHISRALATDAWNDVTSDIKKVLNDFQTKADNSIEKLAQSLQKSEQAQKEIELLTQSFNKEWSALQDKINQTKDSGKLKKLEKDAEKLMQWFRKEMAAIEQKFSTDSSDGH